MHTSQRYIIAEITDADFDPGLIPPEKLDNYQIRKAARGILSYQNKIALAFIAKESYHKLPGGGVELGETIEQAFVREIKEETGCNCLITDSPINNSLVLETRQKHKLFQLSYIFSADVIGEPGQINLTDEEISAGFQLKWVTITDAVGLIRNDTPLDYEGKFIQKRDLAILNFFNDQK